MFTFGYTVLWIYILIMCVYFRESFTVLSKGNTLKKTTLVETHRCRLTDAPSIISTWMYCILYMFDVTYFLIISHFLYFYVKGTF